MHASHARIQRISLRAGARCKEEEEQRETMRIAKDTVRWTSKRTPSQHVPKRWGEFEGDDLLRLKDTGSEYWANRLVRPNTFSYTFPARSSREWEAALVKTIRKRVGTQRPLKVHLFATPSGGKNEYYGEWAVSEVKEGSRKSVMTLKRLEVQEDEARYVHDFGGHRSQNELAHDHLLRTRFFPEAQGWVVRHEPETLLDLHQPSVVDGLQRDVVETGRSYTCDFVLQRGLERLCVESKPTVQHVTDEARTKCRLLRDPRSRACSSCAAWATRT